MARVLFALELGGGYGHLAHLWPVLRSFAAAGWETSVAAGDPRPFRAAGLPARQAPGADPSPAGVPALNLPAVLLEWGYGSAASLALLVAGWRRLFADERADVVCAEYAPTALLAARLAGLPSIALGMGYFLPPLVAPLPSLQPWRTVGEDELAGPEAAALAAVNAVASGAGTPPLARFADVWDASARFLCTWPELDHYGTRPEERYWGPLLAAAPSSSLPAGPPRAFAYLRAADPRLPLLLDAFSAVGIELTAHLRGASAAQLDALAGPGRRLSPQPLEPLAAISGAHFVLSNGGHGLASQALRAGRPLLLLPSQAEQAALAVRLARQGLAFVVDPRRAQPDFAVPLRKLAAGALAEGAQAFAARRAGHDCAALADEIAGAARRLLSAN